MNGTLIVIEGSDGAGKATQTQLLFERLSEESDRRIRKISFPDYQSDSSALIRMYLHGDFGSRPSDVNPYAASTFYAVDRYASFKANWQRFYEAGDIIIADRYVPSNMAHQAIKLDDELERREFLTWLDDLEYNKLNLPRPELILFLDMPPSIAERLIAERNRLDIHETDREYLSRCYRAYRELSAQYHWTTINCSLDDAARGVEDIHRDVFDAVRQKL